MQRMCCQGRGTDSLWRKKMSYIQAFDKIKVKVPQAQFLESLGDLHEVKEFHQVFSDGYSDQLGIG